MSKKSFIAGLVLGATLFGVTPAVASGIVANLSTQPIFVDGEQVEMTAYSINGNNYVKLRDIGKEVGFNVSWNYDESRVDIDSDSPYIADDMGDVAPPSTNTTMEEMLTVTQASSTTTKDKYAISIDNTTTPGALSNGTTITEDNILAVIDEITDIFPDGTSWGATYNTGDEYWYGIGGGCNSFAWMTRDLLYGTDCTPVSTHNILANVKAGDVVQLKHNGTGDEHWIVVTGTGLSNAGHPIIYCIEGNSNGCVKVSSRYIEATQYDYPNSTIYSYY